MGYLVAFLLATLGEFSIRSSPQKISLVSIHQAFWWHGQLELSVPASEEYIAGLCLCIYGFICGICFVIICSSYLLFLCAWGGLCFMIVAFLKYLHLYFLYTVSSHLIFKSFLRQACLEMIMSFSRMLANCPGLAVLQLYVLSALYPDWFHFNLRHFQTNDALTLAILLFMWFLLFTSSLMITVPDRVLPKYVNLMTASSFHCNHGLIVCINSYVLPYPETVLQDCLQVWYCTWRLWVPGDCGWDSLARIFSRYGTIPGDCGYLVSRLRVSRTVVSRQDTSRLWSQGKVPEDPGSRDTGLYSGTSLRLMLPKWWKNFFYKIRNLYEVFYFFNSEHWWRPDYTCIMTWLHWVTFQN